MAKRSLSDSDCDDLFSDTKDSCMTPPGTDSCGHHVSRKKRRGIIEKRRRDRINNSLTELRRLVPTAFEKQGSAKLEKAEILQMTVDHLKMLHSKGLDALAYDPHKFAMDYHTIGFRECSSEVARYLVTVEGMNTQDPLRLRLMSHLQCFVAQRELANKQASASSWGLNPLTPTPAYTINSHHLHHLNSGNTGMAAPSSLQSSQQGSVMEPSSPDQYILLPHNPSHSNMSNDTLLHHQHQHQHQHLSGGNGQHQHSNSSGGNNMGTATHQRPSSASSGSYQHPMSPYGMTHHQNNNNTTGYIPNGKPYRPWGAELAY